VILLKALTEHNTTLTELHLEDNSNVSETMDSVIYAFVDANKAGIRLLHAGAEQAKRIATELADNATMTMLVLNKNEIGHQGCVDIAHALFKNHILTSIEMNDNSIGDDGSTALAAMLYRADKDFVKWNRIGPSGATALAEMLRMNTSLQELGLGQNNVGNEGSVAIAGALRRNATLKRIDLSSNRISDVGAMAILMSLTESNCALMWLNLKNNAIISQGLQRGIDFVLASRQVLKPFSNVFASCKVMPLVGYPWCTEPRARELTTTGLYFFV
jgi:NLR family CARD domain-containing protein 3